MKNYRIEAQNLNDALTFYHALFDRMPSRMTHEHFQFALDEFVLEVRETDQPTTGTLLYEIGNQQELERTYQRMRRFTMRQQLKNDCSSLDQAFGLVDPTGNRWKIGDRNTSVTFEQCYTMNNYNK